MLNRDHCDIPVLRAALLSTKSSEKLRCPRFAQEFNSLSRPNDYRKLRIVDEIEPPEPPSGTATLGPYSSMQLFQPKRFPLAQQLFFFFFLEKTASARAGLIADKDSCSGRSRKALQSTISLTPSIRAAIAREPQKPKIGRTAPRILLDLRACPRPSSIADMRTKIEAHQLHAWSRSELPRDTTEPCPPSWLSSVTPGKCSDPDKTQSLAICTYAYQHVIADNRAHTPPTSVPR